MSLSILSSRDTDPNVSLSFSFNVSYGPPSRINCVNSNNEEIFYARGDHSQTTHEVIRPHFIDTTEPDMTRVTVKVYSQPRRNDTYICYVAVEGRTGISGIKSIVVMGMGFTSLKVTGKYLKIFTFCVIIFLVFL